MTNARGRVAWLGLAGLLALPAACVSDVRGEAGDESDQVMLVSQALSESTVSAVSFNELAKDFPAEVAAEIDVGALRAADVVGWYDKGHNFHKEKMEKNLKSDFGDLVTNPAVLRGKVVNEAEVEIAR